MSNAAVVTGAAGRYATALFELAQESGALDAVESEAKTLSSLIGESADLKHLITSQAHSREQQAQVMRAVADKAGMGSLVKNFIGLMASKGRLALLPAALQGVSALAERHRGEVVAEVVSARPLTDGQRDALAATLRQSVGKDVKIEASVDPSLIGGLVVKVGSKMIDASLRSKLSSLQLAMKEVG